MIEIVASICIGIITAVFVFCMIANHGMESELEQLYNDLHERVSVLEQEDDLK